ncbi:hypothetical protein NPIL_595881, partial [Nephila pilipes]
MERSGVPKGRRMIWLLRLQTLVGHSEATFTS